MFRLGYFLYPHLAIISFGFCLRCIFYGFGTILLISIVEPDFDNFKKKYGHSDDYSLSDALWTCSTLFSNW